MSPVLAVKRCSRVTAARAAYFRHDQDPKRKFCVNISRGAAGIIMGYLELFDFGESEVRSASEETVARMSAVWVSRKALNQSAAVARHSRCRGNIIVVASI